MNARSVVVVDITDATALHRNPATLRGTRLRVEDTPEWVTRRTVKDVPRNNHEPITLLLLDRQIHVDRMMRYTRFVRRLETPQAVQEAGRIELDFDPATQALLLHGISIFRNGELTNLVNLDEVEIIQRERDLEKGIYAGSITALIILKDVRTGDVIDIESTIHSDDAIFPGHYWFQENFEHTLPVAAQYFSWTAGDLDRFEIRSTYDEAEPRREATPYGDRLTWERAKAPAVELEPALPLGYNPFKHVALTSFRDWREVAAEIAELWSATTTDPGEELLAELAKLQGEREPGSAALIEHLVAFVRDTIRYQGVEVGRLGLVPDALQVIWERRFGDCKEKTSLLCWLLQQCGFEATPALVSTTMFGRISDQIPGPIFDHVVVHLRHEEKSYWIDPTNISQRGTLRDWTSLPFEKALLIAPDSTDFLEIPPPPPTSDMLRVHEDYRFETGNKAKLVVTHEYNGEQADQVRHVLETQGRVAVQQIFVEIVKSTRSGAEIARDLEVRDDPDANRLVLSSEFTATEIFSPNGPGQSYTCEFVPHSIVGKIVGVDDKARRHPLGLIYPVNIEHTTRIGHPDAKGSVVPKTQIDNEFLHFEAGTSNEKTAPTLFYKFRTKMPEVPVSELPRYRLNLKQISGVISLLFHTDHLLGNGRGKGDRGAAQHPGRKKSSLPVWLLVLLTVIVLKILLGLLSDG